MNVENDWQAVLYIQNYLLWIRIRLSYELRIRILLDFQIGPDPVPDPTLYIYFYSIRYRYQWFLRQFFKNTDFQYLLFNGEHC
jgi:hypothetical protein